MVRKLRRQPISMGFIGILVLAALFPPLWGCGGGAEKESSGKLQVVCTTGMIGWMAAEVAGDAADVLSLMGPGVDPHLYKASEGDVRRLSQADLVLYNGLHLEGKMGDILGKMGRKRPVVAVTEGLPEDRLRALPEGEGHDPHVWFDVALWAQTADLIAAELGAVHPASAKEFAQRARGLKEKLASLDAWVAAEIAAIPARQRLLITAHDAFGYFGDRYDIEVMGLQGVSTLSEAGLQDVDQLVEIIVDRQVPALFVESSVPRRAIEAVQAACADRGHQVSIGGELFSDAMGAAGSPEGDYPGMVRHNVETIARALTDSASKP